MLSRDILEKLTKRDQMPMWSLRRYPHAMHEKVLNNDDIVTKTRSGCNMGSLENVTMNNIKIF